MYCSSRAACTAAWLELSLHCLLWAAGSYMRVSCFPVFQMVDKNRKGVSRSWSRALNNKKKKKISMMKRARRETLRRVGRLAKDFPHPIFSACARSVRNNTNLFTRLSNAGYWRVAISRNPYREEEVHQVGHNV